MDYPHTVICIFFFNLRALYNSELPSAVPARPPPRAGRRDDALGWSSHSLPACLIPRAVGEVGSLLMNERRGTDGMETEMFSPFTQLLMSGALAPISRDVPAS